MMTDEKLRDLLLTVRRALLMICNWIAKHYDK